jgi:hypothetical protein
MSDGGKGSSPRPFSVPKEEFDNRWEVIFGKKQKQEQTQVEDCVVDGDLPKDSDQDG